MHSMRKSTNTGFNDSGVLYGAVHLVTTKLVQWLCGTATAQNREPKIKIYATTDIVLYFGLVQYFKTYKCH